MHKYQQNKNEFIGLEVVEQQYIFTEQVSYSFVKLRKGSAKHCSIFSFMKKPFFLKKCDFYFEEIDHKSEKSPWLCLREFLEKPPSYKNVFFN